MEDLTGLGKLAESKVVNAACDDLISKAAKEGGNALVDVVKTFRLFTAPIQLLAAAQDRLARFCEKVREDVPVERQIEAAPSVAIPILLALRYMEDDNPVTELFLNLLRRAIDRERVHEAHPAFPRIIEQLSRDEAMIMYSLREKEYMCVLLDVRQGNSFPFHRLTFSEDIKFYCRHLATLDLLRLSSPPILVRHS